MSEQTFTKYERARILGARALQIAMNAPLLIKINQEDLEKINFNALKIAEIELDSGILPISVKKPMPKKKKEKLQRAKEVKLSEKRKKELEAEEEKEIAESGEIMQTVDPEEEKEIQNLEKSEEEIAREDLE